MRPAGRFVYTPRMRRNTVKRKDLNAARNRHVHNRRCIGCELGVGNGVGDPKSCKNGCPEQNSEYEIVLHAYIDALQLHLRGVFAEQLEKSFHRSSRCILEVARHAVTAAYLTFVLENRARIHPQRAAVAPMQLAPGQIAFGVRRRMEFAAAQTGVGVSDRTLLGVPNAMLRAILSLR